MSRFFGPSVQLFSSLFAVAALLIPQGLLAADYFFKTTPPVAGAEVLVDGRAAGTPDAKGYHGSASGSSDGGRPPPQRRMIEPMKDESARAVSWMQQWRAAGPALEEVRERELRDLTDDQALEATEELLSMANTMPLPPDRLGTSGLVAQQALFHRRASR